MLRASGPGLLLVVAVMAGAGCRRQVDAGRAPGTPQSTAAPGEAADDRVLCQPAGAPAMAPDCSLLREQTSRGLVLTLSRPDGGFRRLLVLPGGRGLVAADGSERARVSATGPAEVEVEVGGDRFRLPAKLPRR